MDIFPIQTEEDYKAALREVSVFFDSEPIPGSVDGDRFRILLAIVEAYESKHQPIGFPDLLKENEALPAVPSDLNQSKHAD